MSPVPIDSLPAGSVTSHPSAEPAANFESSMFSLNVNLIASIFPSPLVSWVSAELSCGGVVSRTVTVLVTGVASFPASSPAV